MVNRSRSFASTSLLLAVLATVASPSDLAAQGFGGVPTFLAIPDVYPSFEGPVAVLRERGRNVILLRASDATPETLSVALGLLRRLTQRRPLEPGRSHLAPVTGYHLRSPLWPAQYTHLNDLLTRLRARPSARIGNLGSGRFLPLVDDEG